MEHHRVHASVHVRHVWRAEKAKKTLGRDHIFVRDCESASNIDQLPGEHLAMSQIVVRPILFGRRPKVSPAPRSAEVQVPPAHDVLLPWR
jgi:hypothetical protein